MPATNPFVSLEISPDCKTLTLVINQDPNTNCNDAILHYQYTNNTTGFAPTEDIYNDDTCGAYADNGIPAYYYEDSVTGNWYTQLTAETIGETSLNGVITISIYDPVNAGFDFQISAVGSCELDCCIASLVQDAIDCTCKCEKCNEDLATAQKVHLLAESAKYSALNANLQDAIDKYNKAKDFCTATCACGC